MIHTTVGRGARGRSSGLLGQSDWQHHSLPSQMRKGWRLERRTLARQAAWALIPSRMPATLPKHNSLDASTPAAAHRGTLSSWKWLLWDQQYKKRALTDVCQNQNKQKSHEAPYLYYVEGKRHLIFFPFFFSPVDLVEGNQYWWMETVSRILPSGWGPCRTPETCTRCQIM